MTDEREPPRFELDFHVLVHFHGDDMPTDVTHAVMDVYDIAVNSMDFGSGFLSTEEVGNLRTLGEAIGADRFDYQHDKCLRCGHDYERHYEKSCSEGYSHRKGDPFPCSCTGFTRG